MKRTTKRYLLIESDKATDCMELRLLVESGDVGKWSVGRCLEWFEVLDGR
jgi:hypothetical protein